MDRGVVAAANVLPTEAVRDRFHACSTTLDPERLWIHRERLYAAALALSHSREDAEDLVQETYSRVLGASRLVEEEREYGYLLSGLRNTFFSALRATARRPETPASQEELESVGSTGAIVIDGAVEEHELLGALSSLPTKSRQVLVAVDLVGLSYPQAARALGIRVGTVKSRLARARARLGPVLGEFR
jgi:RNA polymerase sigma-70 factor (ECF subfamily)